MSSAERVAGFLAMEVPVTSPTSFVVTLVEVVYLTDTSQTSSSRKPCTPNLTLSMRLNQMPKQLPQAKIPEAQEVMGSGASAPEVLEPAPPRIRRPRACEFFVDLSFY